MSNKYRPGVVLVCSQRRIAQQASQMQKNIRQLPKLIQAQFVWFISLMNIEYDWWSRFLG
jgi:hypothetical protein